MPTWTRRNFLTITAGTAAATSFGLTPPKPQSPRLPVRTITQGPKHHWFGYYDKLEFDPNNRFVLSNQVSFEHRTPQADDRIAVGMVDTAEDDCWIPLGTSNAWGWQQGCMLQWRPQSESEVLWNDRDGDQFICRIKNVKTGATRVLPRPVYTVSNSGEFALSAGFARIQRMRPGYGYVGLEDPCQRQRAPADSGVWRLDLESGEAKLIFSLAEAAAIDHQGQSLEGHWHYFNHLLINPDDSRFIVLHRWRKSTGSGPNAEPTGGFTTRMFTVAMDGTEKFIVDPSGFTSHFIWRDTSHICAWTRPAGQSAGFYLFRDQTEVIERVGEGVMTVNGHNTYLPAHDNEWILNDTYPQGPRREQIPYLYHVPTQRRVELGRFPSPGEYRGEWRCDLHPRSSNDGRIVAIDSPHAGHGRQIHLIDVSEIVD